MSILIFLQAALNRQEESIGLLPYYLFWEVPRCGIFRVVQSPSRLHNNVSLFDLQWTC